MDTEFVLVDKYDNIRNRTTLSSGVGISGAKTYFMKIKQINEEGFNSVWKVMTIEEYDRIHKQGLHDRQMGKMKYEWWKEEDAYLDGEKS